MASVSKSTPNPFEFEQYHALTSLAWTLVDIWRNSMYAHFSQPPSICWHCPMAVDPYFVKLQIHLPGEFGIANPEKALMFTLVMPASIALVATVVHAVGIGATYVNSGSRLPPWTVSPPR